MLVTIKKLHTEMLTERIRLQNIFYNLTEYEVQNLLDISTTHAFEAGKTLTHQGDVPGYLYCVIDGTLRTFINGTDGRETTVHLLKSGDACMGTGIFTGAPSPVTVQAVEKTKVLAMPEGSIKKHALKSPQFAENLLGLLAKCNLNTLHQLDNIVAKTPFHRLGHYFLELHLDQGYDKPEFTLPFQKQLIANHLGMTPETFSRALKELRKNGVAIDRENMHLHDINALCSFCDADTAFKCGNRDKNTCSSCTCPS